MKRATDGHFAKLDYGAIDRIADVGATAFSVYCAMLRFVDFRTRRGHPAVETIAHVAGLRERATQIHISRLVDAGMVKVTPRAGSSNEYHLPHIGGASPCTPASPCGGGAHRDAGEGRTTVRPDKRQEQETPNKKARTRPGKRIGYTPEFESWWSRYPMKVGKGAASKAYGEAVSALVSSTSHPDITDADQAHEWLCKRTDLYAPHGTLKRSEGYCPHPATWLNGGRYDDDSSAWSVSTTGQSEPDYMQPLTAPPEPALSS